MEKNKGNPRDPNINCVLHHSDIPGLRTHQSERTVRISISQKLKTKTQPGTRPPWSMATVPAMQRMRIKGGKMLMPELPNLRLAPK